MTLGKFQHDDGSAEDVYLQFLHDGLKSHEDLLNHITEEVLYTTKVKRIQDGEVIGTTYLNPIERATIMELISHAMFLEIKFPMNVSPAVWERKGTLHMFKTFQRLRARGCIPKSLMPEGFYRNPQPKPTDTPAATTTTTTTTPTASPPDRVAEF